MTSQLEDTLGLPRLEDALKQLNPTTEVENVENDENQNLIDSLDSANEEFNVVGTEDGTFEHVQEMDELYEQAMSVHRDLVDLAFNMDSGKAGSILEPAVQILQVALQASKNKSSHKLNRLKLKLDQAKFEHARNNNPKNGIIESSTGGVTATRDQLLKMIDDEGE